MVSLTCGFSLQKTARIIAITDLVYCFFSVIVRTAISVIQAAYSVQVQPLSRNDPNDMYNSPPVFQSSNTMSINGETTSIPPTVVLQDGSSDNAEREAEEFSISITSVFAFLLILMAGTVLYIVFELWMCRLLLGAAKNLDKENCKRWWWYRLTMTVVLMFICIILTLVINRGWFSWFMELVVIYRVYELVVIHKFKNEIGATSSRVQIGNFPQ